MLRDMGGEWRVETAKPHMQIFTKVVLVAFFRHSLFAQFERLYFTQDCPSTSITTKDVWPSG